jgi:phenylpropionate dioxygenase-like ring-hydroxylating dioxygenase large terminal subunit
MTSYIKSFFGSSATAPQVEGTQRGLPASWYRSPELYELERRAIFSKHWMLVTHRNRLVAVGDYLRITEAGFTFFLCMDRQGQIGGFHNICRHRAFPLVHEDTGNVKILACKYHGWSYGIDGKLAKAPHFEKFPDFRKEDNSLLPVHVHIDKLGFVWVNLDASQEPSISWETQFRGIDQQERFSHFNFSDYRYDHTWGMQGDYNWKTLADNYNECLHCRTAHPDTNGLVDISVYRVEGQDGSLAHFNKRQEDGQNEGKVQLASTYYFPNACMTVS